ncbi:MAG TPA: GGDEF domain-containing protein [Candidatus Binatia bacterium]|nr:GGDEF domain-containing protein [Candidatus Binatia bacterium]
MSAHRLATASAIVTALVAGIYLFAWGALWRLLAARPLPDALQLPPLEALLILFAAAALLCAAMQGPQMRNALLTSVVFAIAGFVMIEHVLGLHNGLEQQVFGGAVEAVYGASEAGRPGAVPCTILLFLALGLGLQRPQRPPRMDAADVWCGAALFLSFAALVQQLYQFEDAAHAGTASASVSEALLLMMLSLGGLALNPHGLLSGYAADTAGSGAKRRLMPAVVSTPVLLGLVALLTLQSSALDLATALALTVTANVAVFLALTIWVSRLLNQLQAEQRGEMLQREQAVREEGMTDILTGLLNRRGWEMRLQQVEDLSRRNGGNAAVIVIDLDGLKRINDTQGHAQGDALIKRAGNALRGAARRDDYLARLGGDEFAYLAVGCEPQHAHIVLSRLSHALEKAEVQASLGYAMRDLAGSLTAAFAEADHAMYQHKRARKAQSAPLTKPATR